MSKHEIKALYNTLLESGDLLEMFPNFKGSWDKDKKEFTRQYSMNEEFLEDEEEDLYGSEFLDDTY